MVSGERLCSDGFERMLEKKKKKKKKQFDEKLYSVHFSFSRHCNRLLEDEVEGEEEVSCVNI
ncbi:hypothetical protein Csa_005358 [Cucumis sativus]|uniref:Uncharacterized protein n=1 Tax=Cucumis sativus TaxID=3659 RepID=A0A0A0K7F8_CUCSA|nr:hypothetical protein Csa_005358 [Cucumis sativus]